MLAIYWGSPAENGALGVSVAVLVIVGVTSEKAVAEGASVNVGSRVGVSETACEGVTVQVAAI